MHSLSLMNVDMYDKVQLMPESRTGTVSFTLVSFAYTCRWFSSHIVLYMLWNVCAGVWNFEFVFFRCCMQCVVKVRSLHQYKTMVNMNTPFCTLLFGFGCLLQVLKIW